MWISVSPSSAITRAASAGSVGLDGRLGVAAGRAARRWSPGRPVGPTCITPRWVHICSTSASRWLDTSTVVPSPASDADQLAHLAGALRVEAVGRLVEHQQVLGGQQGAGDREPLPHPERVRAEPLVGRGQQADPVERRVDPVSRAVAGRPCGRRRRAGAGCAVPTGRGGTPAPRPVQPTAGQHVARPGPASPAPNSSTSPAGRRDQAEQHPDGGGLARPVGTEEPVDRAGRAPRGRSRRRPSATRSAWSARWCGRRDPSRARGRGRGTAVTGTRHRSRPARRRSGPPRTAPTGAGGPSPTSPRREGATSSRALVVPPASGPRPGRPGGWRPGRWSSPCRRPSGARRPTAGRAGRAPVGCESGVTLLDRGARAAG